MKSWVQSLWAKASKNATEDTIQPQHVEDAATIPAIGNGSTSQDVSTFANGIGLKNFNDYQKTAEHWRLIFSVMMEAIAKPDPKRQLKPFSEEALSALADKATTLSLHLLKSSTTQARNSGHTVINTSDLHTACLLYTSPSPRDATLSRMPSSA